MASTAPGSEIAIAPRGELAPGRLRCVGCGAAQDARRPVMRADPESRPFDLYRCAACGLVQQHPRAPGSVGPPRPTWQINNASSGDRSLVPPQPTFAERSAASAEDEPACWARAVQQYVVHVLRHETPRYRRLLQVGCGFGYFSALAAQRGWQVVGLDLSAESVSRAAARFGLDFRAGSLAQHCRTLPPFDVVFLGGLIERLPEPAALLHEVRRILAPGGVACLDTPNWGGRWRRWGGSRWLGLDRRHVNLFDADSLTRTLRTCGFEQIEIGGYTPYRYESLAVRPEVQHYVRKLPGFIARRLNRYFDRRAARSPWAILRSAPPATLEAALRLLGDLASLVSPSATPSASCLRADALTAAARRI
jgi:SAM-dependent methyltransferase